MLNMEQRKIQLLTQIREGTLKRLSIQDHFDTHTDPAVYMRLRSDNAAGKDVPPESASLFEDLDHLHSLHREGYIVTNPREPRCDPLGRSTDFHNLEITEAGRAILE